MMVVSYFYPICFLNPADWWRHDERATGSSRGISQHRKRGRCLLALQTRSAGGSGTDISCGRCGPWLFLQVNLIVWVIHTVWHELWWIWQWLASVCMETRKWIKHEYSDLNRKMVYCRFGFIKSVFITTSLCTECEEQIWNFMYR